jgi:hypothetical protein
MPGRTKPKTRTLAQVRNPPGKPKLPKGKKKSPPVQVASASAKGFVAAKTSKLSLG